MTHNLVITVDGIEGNPGYMRFSNIDRLILISMDFRDWVENRIKRQIFSNVSQLIQSVIYRVLQLIHKWSQVWGRNHENTNGSIAFEYNTSALILMYGNTWKLAINCHF